MKPVALEDIRSLKFLSKVAFAPDGRTACFAVARAEEKGYASGLYICRGRKITRLTGGGKESSFCWLDAKSILFAGDREAEKAGPAETRFYTIRIDGGEAGKAFTLPVQASRYIPLPGGDGLVEAAVYPGFEKLYTGDSREAKRFEAWQKDEADYEVVTQAPWWWNGDTFTRGRYTGLFYHHRKKNKLTWLTRPGFSVSDVQLAPDGKTVYYSLTDMQTAAPDYFTGLQLYRMDLASREETEVLHSTGALSILDYALGEHFAVVAAMDWKYGGNTDPDLYRLDYDTCSLTLLCSYGYAIGTSVGSDIRHGGGTAMKMAGDALYFISTRFDSAQLYKLEEGSICAITEKEGSVDCFDVCGDQLLMVALWDMKPQELYDGSGTQLSHFNDRYVRGHFISLPESCHAMSRGEEIHGFVLKPKDYIPGKKYPVILDIHGGPKTVYGKVFYHEMQYWAGLGYFVIFCNPVGSDGRGGFMDICGRYGTIDYDDIIAFTDRALAAYPDMDEANLFETGGSYGGFMTNWIIGHTDRFRACASQRSISNWFSFYGVSDIGMDFCADQNRSDPWHDPEKLWFHSPLRYADQAKTPTLFIHSFEDYRCPIDQGYQMYTALIAHGVEAKMVLFRGENHDLSRSGRPDHRLRRLKEITAWFEAHKG